MEKKLAKSVPKLNDDIISVSWLSGSIPGKHLMSISGTQACLLSATANEAYISRTGLSVA